MRRLATPTDGPGGPTILRARWGALFGAVIAAGDLAASGPAEGVTAINLVPSLALLGAAFGLALWDAPSAPAWLRRVAIALGAALGLIAAFFVPTWQTAQPPVWHGFVASSAGVVLLALGLLWHRLGRAHAGLLMVTGTSTTILVSLTHPDPAIWPLLPAWAMTYVPLVHWLRMDRWLRAYGLVGNVTAIVLVQNLAPLWLLDSNWAPFALAIVYVTAMVLLHLYRALPAERWADVGWWLVALFAVATVLAAVGHLPFLAWVPTPALLLLLILLGALHAGGGERTRRWAQRVSLVLGGLSVLLGLSTLIGRLRVGDNPWESLVLLVFGAMVMAGWWFLPPRAAAAQPAAA